jgi:hypothetical protein
MYTSELFPGDTRLVWKHVQDMQKTVLNKWRMLKTDKIDHTKFEVSLQIHNVHTVLKSYTKYFKLM